MESARLWLVGTASPIYIYVLPVLAGLFLYFAAMHGIREFYRWRKKMKRNQLAQERRKSPRTNFNTSAIDKEFVPVTVKQATIAKQLLGEQEKEFFRMLLEAMPDHYIFAQVSFNALVSHASNIWNKEARRYIRRSFSTKYVDFAVCHPRDFQVIALIEYDGTGHHDTERDDVLRSVGYRVERFTPGVTTEIIRQRISAHIQKF